jgi:hypothetical protein
MPAMKHSHTLLLACAMAASLSKPAAAEPRAVLELFTSQGCSSCPAADRLLGELAKDSSVIALSLPVDYWDYLGWKDTLAYPRNSARQRAYSRVRGDREIYTPQIVVNGVIPVLGSNKSDIDDAISQSRRNTMTLAVRLSRAADVLTVSVPDASGSFAKGEVWICGVTRSVPVDIGRGENSGRKITYVNVTRRWVKAGDWNGKAASWTISVRDIADEGVDSAAAIVQSGDVDRPGPMIGATLMSLR